MARRLFDGFLPSQQDLVEAKKKKVEDEEPTSSNGLDTNIDSSVTPDQSQPTDMQQDPNAAPVADPNNMTQRSVKGAHLVYKRANDEGSFEELWIYRLNDLKDDNKILKAILAGTDIPDGMTASTDGSQTYEMWTAGTAQMVLITGLPN